MVSSVFAVINENGITAPTYNEIVNYYKEKYREIYGADTYLENDSQDGQWIGVQAVVVQECNSLFINLYNSFSPNTAARDALIRNVKINNIKLQKAPKATVGLRIVGVSGTVIKNGIVIDKNNNRWFLPTTVTIGNTGLVEITATAEKYGIIIATTNSVNSIATPIRGWISVTNPSSSNLGSEIETDFKLRQIQALSTMNSALSLAEAIRGAILAIDGVTRCRVFENKTKNIDSNGLPPNSFCAVVYGGDSQEIAKVIKSKKSMGCALYGNTQISILNTYNEMEIFSFFRANVINIAYVLKIETNDSYSADTAMLIQEALANYTNDLGIGDRINLNKIIGVANLNGAELGQTYEVSEVKIKVNGTVVDSSYVLPFGSVAFCIATTIEIEVIRG